MSGPDRDTRRWEWTQERAADTLADRYAEPGEIREAARFLLGELVRVEEENQRLEQIAAAARRFREAVVHHDFHPDAKGAATARLYAEETLVAALSVGGRPEDTQP